MVGMLSVKLGSELMGYSEQAYHKAERHAESATSKQLALEIAVKEAIKEIRQRMPRIGGEKLWIMTQSKLSSLGLSIGFDTRSTRTISRYGYNADRNRSRRCVYALGNRCLF
jgi:hypothetical protein